MIDLTTIRLYQHDDGRYGVSFGPAKFAEGEPAWHRVPVDVLELPDQPEGTEGRNHG